MFVYRIFVMCFDEGVATWNKSGILSFFRGETRGGKVLGIKVAISY